MFHIFKNRFLSNAITLAGTAFITRAIGMMFRIYMSGRIGAEGVGLYQLILTVFLFFSTVTATGMSLSVTRMASELTAQGKYGQARRATSLCVMISVGASVLGGTILFCGADFIAETLLHDGRTALSLKILAPALPFMAVSSCFRGFFYARRNALKTSSEQLLEQLIEIGVFAAVISYLAPKGIEYACCGICIGTLTAEIISCFYSAILYWIDVCKTKSEKIKISWFLKNSAEISLPVTASSCLRTGLSTVENILIPFGLKKHGSDYRTALSDYGIITGMAMPVLMFPSVLILPFASLIIPEMSQAHAKGDMHSIRRMTQKLFRGVLLYTLPTTVIFMFFSSEFGQVLYNDADIGLYIGILAPIIPFVYLDSVTDGILKGLNEQLSYLVYNVIDSVIRVALTYFLLPIIGVKGIIVVIFVSELLNTVMSIARLLKITQLRLMVCDWIIKPIICSSLPCVVLKPLFFTNISILSLCIKVVLCVVLYLLLLFACGCINREDFSIFKKRTVV